MTIRRLALIAAAALAGLALSAPPADAHQQPYDSGIQTEHNLCQIMRPYGVGTIVAHYRVNGTHRVCFVCIGNTLYAYDIFNYLGVWSGPWNTTIIAPNPSPSC